MRSTIELAIALNLASQLGPIRYQKLVEKAGSIPAIFEPEFLDSIRRAPDRHFPAGLIHDLQQPDWAKVDRAMTWADKPDNHIITLQSHYYPSSLKALSDAPPLLYVMGDPARLSHAQIAIVGSRKSSKYGELATRSLSQDLANQSIVITSGLAHGIDGIAHRACVDTDRATIAVMGRGLAQVYPALHRELATQILTTGGCLISEFPLDSPPVAGNFPRRNRIISGLSLGTLVIEAKIKSGSLITAKLAAEQGKEVFAVPGSINSDLSKGCHYLIQQGAKLIQSAEDILAEIQFEGLAPPTKKPVNRSAQHGNYPSEQLANTTKLPLDSVNELTFDQQTILDSMGFDPISIDSLQSATRLTIDSLSAMLLDLELSDWIIQDAHGNYQRIKS